VVDEHPAPIDRYAAAVSYNPQPGFPQGDANYPAPGPGGWQQAGRAPGGYQAPQGVPTYGQPAGRGSTPVLFTTALLGIATALLWLDIGIVGLVKSIGNDSFSAPADRTIAEKIGNPGALRVITTAAHGTEIVAGVALLVGAVLLFARRRSGVVVAAIGGGLGLVVLVLFGLRSTAWSAYSPLPPTTRILVAVLGFVVLVLAMLPAVKLATRPAAPPGAQNTGPFPQGHQGPGTYPSGTYPQGPQPPGTCPPPV
jgi:uncharacterized protein (TIGR03382 family)